MDIPTRKPRRLWPGVVIVVVQLLLRVRPPCRRTRRHGVGLFGGLICALAAVLWWLLLSRAPWFESLGAVALMAVGLFATSRTLDKSAATGAQGFLFWFLAFPVLGIALVAGAVGTSRLPDGIRRATMAATILAACGRSSGLGASPRPPSRTTCIGGGQRHPRNGSWLNPATNRGPWRQLLQHW
jgi:hypothetical protein